MRRPVRALQINPVSGRLLAAALLAAALIAAIPAHGQGKLEARYGVTMAGIPIGQATWSVDIGSDRYVTSATGKASGVMSVVVSGEGTMSSRGAINGGRLMPASFVSSLTQDGDTSDTRMVLDKGFAKEISSDTAKPAPDRIPLTEAHRHNIVDPVTALLLPVSGAGEGVGKDDCQRTLPVFDGRRRYDLKLSFKRMDNVKADKGYAGPVAVCAVNFQAKAGHRASSPLVKYLSEGREIELWLAPISGTRMLAPFRASFASMLGNLVVHARQFDVSRQTASAK